MTKTTNPTNSPLVFAPYIFPDEEVKPKRMQRQSVQAITDAITEIGTNKTTDRKIANACKRYSVDEARVRIIAGFDKNGVNECKIIRL